MNKLLSKKNILFFFLILCFTLPRTVQSLKYFLLVIIVFYFFKDFRLIKNYFSYVFFLLILFIIPTLVGVLNNNETALIFDALKSNIIFPISVFTILQCFEKDEILKIIIKSSKISIVLIFLILLSTVLFAFNLVPINLNEIFYPDETNMRVTGGFFHFINSSLSYLLFIIPIAFLPINKNKVKVILLLTLFVIIILTGRRILILPFLIIFLYHFKRFIIPAFLLVIVLNTYDFSNVIEKEVVVERFSNALNSTGDSTVRAEQSRYFEKNIVLRPFFGHGIGSYMKEYIRNYEFKTAYERSFHYQLYSLGIPITIIMWAFYFFMIRKIYKIDKIYIGLVLGSVSLLLSSYTNPYWLSSFDYCIPLSILMRLSQSEK